MSHYRRHSDSQRRNKLAGLSAGGQDTFQFDQTYIRDLNIPRALENNNASLYPQPRNTTLRGASENLSDYRIPDVEDGILSDASLADDVLGAFADALRMRSCRSDRRSDRRSSRRSNHRSDRRSRRSDHRSDRRSRRSDRRSDRRSSRRSNHRSDRRSRSSFRRS
jgi:hypothetical protein